ncbi:anti-sigma-D factor RsdA [Prescottella defluvii]|uniref:anti-sigma-D factor RsdA n=1 Tax=Prescottella defluvii TaxID=1323361 RepID=UPI0004F3BCD1|nr:anti-sigma-D factor RsdA [Prescottella defluvii]
MARGNKGEPGDPHADLAGNGAPVDVAAVRRDDALIDSIAGDRPVATDSPEEYQVAALLANWRTEILAQPLPAEPDLDDIVERVHRELEAQDSLSTRSRSGRSHLRLLRPIAAAAAVVAIAMGGMSVFSYNAEPGDPLWGVKQVVFTERAASTVAKIDTTSNLEDAERLIASGDTVGAKAKLDSAGARASAVSEAGTRGELNVWRDRLLTELQKAVPPPAPPVPLTPPPPPSTAGDSSSAGSGPSSPIATGWPSPTIDPRIQAVVPSTSPGPSQPPSPTVTSTPNPPTSTSGTQPPSPTPTTTTTPPATSTTRATSGSLDGQPSVTSSP